MGDARTALRVPIEEVIAACRVGSRERLGVILGDHFRSLGGRTGQILDEARSAADLRAAPAPSVGLDQLDSHLTGQTAMVSARTLSDDRSGRANRCLDTYPRGDRRWLRVRACVWPLATPLAEVAKSLYVLQSGQIPLLHRGWFDGTRTQLRGVDMQVLRAIVPAP